MTYRYIRFSRRLEPFESPQLDELARRMGVLSRLNRKQRYFLSRRTYSAFSFPGGVAFGSWYWNSLEDGERMAIAAHEFSHIRSNDMIRRFWRIAVPSLVVTLVIMLAVSSMLVYGPSIAIFALPGLALGTVLTFVCSFMILGSINAGWRRSMEMRCDIDASKYANGEDLIHTLSLWEGAISEKVKKTIRYRILSRFYPTLAERTQAIRAATENNIHP